MTIDRYHIIATDKLKIDDVLSQLRAIKDFPCAVKLYDRAFVIETHNECWCLIQGLEIGAFLAQDLQEKESAPLPLTTQAKGLW